MQGEVVVISNSLSVLLSRCSVSESGLHFEQKDTLMSKPIMLFLNGESGTGKSFFKENIVPAGTFHNLISATTRGIRADETDGVSYYFRDEAWFDAERSAGNLATYLFVNEYLWKPGDKKWLYGLPTDEIYKHIGENLIYDVIQPRYTRELIDWFKKHKLDKMYDFRVAWFTTYDADNFAVAVERACMKNDMTVRRQNTCNMTDFENAGITPDYITRPRDNKPNMNLIDTVRHVEKRSQSTVPMITPFVRTKFLQRDKQYGA